MDDLVKRLREYCNIGADADPVMLKVLSHIRPDIAEAADEIEHLISTLGETLEAMNERRAYCTGWEYKYKDRWDAEDKKVRDVLEVYK